MSVLVKICGITNWADAQASVDAGANALGFNFYSKSPRYITPATAAEIAAKLPQALIKVGVFVNSDPDEVGRIRRLVNLNVVQLHGEEESGEFTNCGRLWRAVRVSEGFDPLTLTRWQAEAFLLDGPAGALYGGAGVAFDWNAARGLQQRIIIAGGLTPENVAEAIRLAEPWGVDACSRLESAPGIKDHERIEAFVRAIRNAERNR